MKIEAGMEADNMLDAVSGGGGPASIPSEDHEPLHWQKKQSKKQPQKQVRLHGDKHG